MSEYKKVEVTRSTAEAISEGLVKMRVSHHEGALICAMEFTVEGEFDEVKEKLSVQLKSLADWLENNNGIVGHIKSFISGDTRSAMLSNTGFDVYARDYTGGTITVDFAAIVYVENERGFKKEAARLPSALRR